MENKAYNLEPFRELLGNDENEMKAMLDLFFKLTPEVLKEMQEAVADRQWKKTGDLAHKIKSSFRLFAMDTLVERAIDIEQRGRQNWNTDQLEIEVETFVSDVNKVITAMKDELKF